MVEPCDESCREDHDHVGECAECGKLRPLAHFPELGGDFCPACYSRLEKDYFGPRFDERYDNE